MTTTTSSPRRLAGTTRRQTASHGLAPSTLRRLDNEWQHLCLDIEALRTAQAWRLSGGPVLSLDGVLARCGYVLAPGHRTHLTDANTASTEDQCLAELISIGAEQPLACRIVLQRILPALVSRANRKGVSHHQRQTLFDDFVANAWSVILRYPVQRRPRRVVSNLVRDVSFATLVRPARLFSSSELATSADDLEASGGQVAMSSDPGATEPLLELASLFAEVRVSHPWLADDIDFLCQWVNHGRSPAMAAALAVTERTVRNKRDASLYRVRAALAEAA